MDFYPRSLNRDWYKADVCDYIFTSLEGAKVWTSYEFQSNIERDPYLDTFQRCIDIVKNNDMQPKAMLEALFEHQELLCTMPKPPFFSRARWLYDPLTARLKAVKTVYELVAGISSRFLP